jgi:hypothetical protein
VTSFVALTPHDPPVRRHATGRPLGSRGFPALQPLAWQFCDVYAELSST